MYRKLMLTAERIEQVLQERGAPASVVGGRVLPSFVEFLLKPSAGTRVGQVQSLRPDIALAVGNNNLRIAQSGSHLAIQIGREAHQPVSFAALMARAQVNHPYSALLGMSQDGAPLLARLTAPSVSHWLVAGATGSGKTTLVQAAIASMAMRLRPSEFGVVMIDPKATLNRSFIQALSRHLLLPVAGTPEAAVAVLRQVTNGALEKRLASGGMSTPLIVVYVDELATLCTDAREAVIEPLTRLTQIGREAAIHVIACTQYPSSKAITPQLKSNLTLRLVGRVASVEDARVAAGAAGTGAERLGNAGDFIAVAGGNAPMRFQAPAFRVEEFVPTWRMSGSVRARDLPVDADEDPVSALSRVNHDNADSVRRDSVRSAPAASVALAPVGAAANADSFDRWRTDRLQPTPGEFVRAGVAFEDYQVWCATHQAGAMTNTAFGIRMRSIYQRGGDEQSRFYRDITLVNDPVGVGQGTEASGGFEGG